MTEGSTALLIRINCLVSKGTTSKLLCGN